MRNEVLPFNRLNFLLRGNELKTLIGSYGNFTLLTFDFDSAQEGLIDDGRIMYVYAVHLLAR